MTNDIRLMNGVTLTAPCGDHGWCDVKVSVTDTSIDITAMDIRRKVNRPFEGAEEDILNVVMEKMTKERMTLVDAFRQTITEYLTPEPEEDGNFPTALPVGLKLYMVETSARHNPDIYEVEILPNHPFEVKYQRMRSSVFGGTDKTAASKQTSLTDPSRVYEDQFLSELECDAIQTALKEGECKHSWAIFFRDRLDAIARYNTAIDGLIEDLKRLKLLR